VESNVIRTIRKVTGQDFTDWFDKYVFSPQAMEHRTQDYYKDSDHDGVWDWIEEDLGLDPENPDTDGDGLPDGDEMGIQWMLASSPNTSLDSPFSDPLSADSPGGRSTSAIAPSPQTSTESRPTNAGSSTSSATDLSFAQITLDGKVDDWPQLKPIGKDPAEPSLPADITAFYLFKDSKYLYLRLDGHFPLNTYEQIAFDIHVRFPSRKGKLFQMSTETTDPGRVHLIPDQGGGHLLFDQQAMYHGAALSKQHYEAIVPLALLGGNPQDIQIHAYIVNQTQMVEDLPQAEQSWLFPTATPKSSPTPSITPAPLPPTPTRSAISVQPSPFPTTPPFSAPLGRPLLWIMGAFLAGLLTGYWSVSFRRRSNG